MKIHNNMITNNKATIYCMEMIKDLGRLNSKFVLKHTNFAIPMKAELQKA